MRSPCGALLFEAAASKILRRFCCFVGPRAAILSQDGQLNKKAIPLGSHCKSRAQLVTKIQEISFAFLASLPVFHFLKFRCLWHFTSLTKLSSFYGPSWCDDSNVRSVNRRNMFYLSQKAVWDPTHHHLLPPGTATLRHKSLRIKNGSWVLLDPFSLIFRVVIFSCQKYIEGPMWASKIVEISYN